MDGYRFIEVQEILIKSDEVFKSIGIWRNTNYYGNPVLHIDVMGSTSGIYRRKV